MSLLYADQLDDHGNVVKQNVIDPIILDDRIAGSHKRNRDNGIPGTVNKITFDKNVKSLRTWLQNRNEWMQQYYGAKLEGLK